MACRCGAPPWAGWVRPHKPKKRKQKQLSEKYQASEEAILIAWILKHPSNILPVFGTTNAQRIKSISKATEIELDLQDWFLLWTASAGKAVP